MHIDDSTFFDAFETLLEKRKERYLSVKEFLKGIIEVMNALNIYLQKEAERISDDEIKLQIPILLGAIEAIKVFTKDYLNLEGNGMKFYIEIKRLRKQEKISIREFYYNLIEVVIRQAKYIYEYEQIPNEKLQRIIPMFLAFLRYFYHFFEEF